MDYTGSKVDVYLLRLILCFSLFDCPLCSIGNRCFRGLLISCLCRLGLLPHHFLESFPILLKKYCETSKFYALVYSTGFYSFTSASSSFFSPSAFLGFFFFFFFSPSPSPPYLSPPISFSRAYSYSFSCCFLDFFCFFCTLSSSCTGFSASTSFS